MKKPNQLNQEADFVHKVVIVLKEARKSHSWLRMLQALNSAPGIAATVVELLAEASEFKNIFASIKLTAQKNRRKT